MKTTICSSCPQPCQIRKESGAFDADGPRGTIRGNLGDVEVSDCCGEPVEEIDSDLFEYWEELKTLAKEQGLDFLIAGPEDHRESFEEGVSAKEELANQIDAAMSSL